MKMAVQYGAGNIGRGFMGQLFSQSGYEVIFIDVNQQIVDQLNKDRSYPVNIVTDTGNEELKIENARAVNGQDMDAIAEEISRADIMATAVGVNILPHIAGPIAGGLKKRWENRNWNPLNIIICENLLDGDKYLASLIRAELSETEKEFVSRYVGFVEASIGRMVPVMTREMQAGNLLRICVEPYSTLPVDKDAFVGEIPDIVNMIPFSPFEVYIQRKLYIHNMGHAVTAYLGARKGFKYIWQAIQDKEVKEIARNAMLESARALAAEHNYPLEDLQEHVDDLISRFGNRQLGDTVERVGRDIARKMSPNDRFMGAVRLCLRHGIDPKNIYIGMAAALKFDDPILKSRITLTGAEYEAYILNEICGLAPDSEILHSIQLAGITKH